MKITTQTMYAFLISTRSACAAPELISRACKPDMRVSHFAFKFRFRVLKRSYRIDDQHVTSTAFERTSSIGDFQCLLSGIRLSNHQEFPYINPSACGHKSRVQRMLRIHEGTGAARLLGF